MIVLQKIKAFFKAYGAGLLSDIFATAGALLLTFGAGAVYAPAGLIVGGICCICAAVIVARGLMGGDGG